ncbi:hypothetical protein E2C01_047622 [Portunus trituberculatus]|uniref:Uncharacterized protein n=1 Tax=Portunus trituberculatus TaxID=210409 RepID=A0A5B7G918_PORTR|nr:hypothetical protein [Portunus trituberculatus]
MEASWYLYQVNIDVGRHTMYIDSVSALLTRGLQNNAQETFTHQGGIKRGFRAHRDVRLVPSLLVKWMQIWVLLQQGCKLAEQLPGDLSIASEDKRSASLYGVGQEQRRV